MSSIKNLPLVSMRHLVNSPRYLLICQKSAHWAKSNAVIVFPNNAFIIGIINCSTTKLLSKAILIISLLSMKTNMLAFIFERNRPKFKRQVCANCTTTFNLSFSHFCLESETKIYYQVSAMIISALITDWIWSFHKTAAARLSVPHTHLLYAIPLHFQFTNKTK